MKFLARIRRWFARSADALTSSEVTERLSKVERALEVQYIGKPQAEADHAVGSAAAQMLSALEKVPNAAVQIGTLLLIKITKEGGQPAVFIRTLSQKQLLMLEAQPDLLMMPDEILRILAQSRQEFPKALDGSC